MNLQQPQLQTVCPICLQVLKEPCALSCHREQKACRECSQQTKKEGRPCSICDASDFTYERDRGLERSLNELEVWCFNRKEGCDWRGKRGQCAQHLNQDPAPENQLTGCQFVVVKCVHRCGERLRRLNISTHQTQQCLKHPYFCQYCQEYESTFKDVTEFHYSRCTISV